MLRGTEQDEARKEISTEFTESTESCVTSEKSHQESHLQHKTSPTPHPPLIDLPPLMKALEEHSVSVSSFVVHTLDVPPLDEPALSSTTHDESHTEFQLALTRLDSLISKLNPPDAEHSTHQEGSEVTSEVTHSHQLEIDDPLSLFDSGASFQGALTPDHPLISDELEGVFDDEEALERDLNAQLLSSLAEPSLTPIEPPPSFFEGFELEGLEELEELEELETGAQTPHLEHLEHRDTAFYHLSSFTLPSFPPLDQRVSALSGHPLNSAQRTLVELIEAREYELALSNLPPIKTTVSSYLEAHCLLGLGRLPDALACSEEGIEASPRDRAAPLYALSAELYEYLGAPLESERCLMELLSIDPSLGRVLYNALRASP
jgi:hypothetical protein